MSMKTKPPSDKGMIRVLVYGTLKAGHANHTLLEQADAVFIGYDSITGPYQLFDLGAIPGVRDTDDGDEHTIRGELWAINPEGLASLDLLEGHPHLYQRRKLVSDVNDRRCWMYFLMADNFMHENAEPARYGLWHPSADENKFWLKQKNAA